MNPALTPPKSQTDVAASLRRHVATIAGDVLDLRRALDRHLAGVDGFGSALRNLSAGIGQLQNLASEIDRGLTRTRPVVGEPAHGDLDGDTLVTKR